jgi:hypothetical protein
MVLCEICNKEYKTNSGLGVHKAYMHGPRSIELRLQRSELSKKIIHPKSEIKRPYMARPYQKGKKFGLSLNGHTEETRKKISDSMKGNRNANHRGDRQSYYKGIRMDSSWEVGTAQYLDKEDISWKYGERGYKLSNGEVYFPDFFIYDNEVFQKIIEVKGYFRERNKKKFEMFLAEYPQVKIELWQRDKLYGLNIIDHSGYLKASA